MDGAGEGAAPVGLSGSEREPLPGAQRVGDVAPTTELDLTIVVRRKSAADTTPDAAVPAADLRASWAERAGADPEAMAEVEEYVKAHGMQVLNADPARRIVAVRGTAEQARSAFGVSLGTYETGELSYRGREGAVQLPPELAGKVDAVLGLDNRPQAQYRLKPGVVLDEARLPDPDAAIQETLAPHATGAAPSNPAPMWPAQVAELYAFPTGFDGTGQTVAIIELGGGFRDEELQTYFARVGVPAPLVTAVPVDGGSNSPGGDADGEVLLDIEVVGALAPGAHIVVYFADPSDRGFYDALSTAVHDSAHNPSVVSISWGGNEDGWTDQARNAFDDVLTDAAALGVTVLAAAGDHGAGDGAPDGLVHADFPASSPHIVACGGTTLIGVDGAAVSETVWNDHDGWATGGGISNHFSVPAFQRSIVLPANLNGTGRPGRGVPDVAGNADSVTGYIVLVDGRYQVVGGTSAVAPLYAALIARLNHALGAPVGNLLEKLYAIPAEEAAEVFRDIVDGDNSVPDSASGPATAGYRATVGWDACSGLGSIHGMALLTHLQNHALAAAPA
jgi:kumamolisin